MIKAKRLKSSTEDINPRSEVSKQAHGQFLKINTLYATEYKSNSGERKREKKINREWKQKEMQGLQKQASKRVGIDDGNSIPHMMEYIHTAISYRFDYMRIFLL